MMPMSKEEAVGYLRRNIYGLREETASMHINAIWPIPDTPEPAPEYGDWIIWNAKPDSKCPVPEGTMGQFQCDDETQKKAQVRFDADISRQRWSYSDVNPNIAAYRIRQTPARGEPIVLYGGIYEGAWLISKSRTEIDTLRITLEADASGAPKDGGIQRVEVLT